MGDKMGGAQDEVYFGKQASLRKWPSLHNERRIDGTGPYLLMDGTLDDCIREFMAKTGASRHLYEICTEEQMPLVPSVLAVEQVRELARFRAFL